MECSSCGTEVPASARFCPSCGSQIGRGEEERRVVTALFADIVGFTTLAEALDPEEVKHLVDDWVTQLARVITDHGGVVDKVMGDAIVALFGAPVAHEDDPERAVRAALGMQTLLHSLADGHGQYPIRMRIGVNTGEVLVGMSSAGGDYTAMGDVMNTASRLEAMAEPGQVLVGDPTRTATSEAISYEPLGLVEARGRSEQVAVWRAVEAIRPPGQRRRRKTPFVGRVDELALLEAQGRLAFAGHRAQMALVVGEAGVGKSRVALEATERIRSAHDARVLSGRCLPYGEANVWWPVAEQVRELFDLELEAPLEEATVVVRRALTERLGPVADLARFERSLLHLLGYETALRGGDRIFNRAEVTLAVTSLLEKVLDDGPLVLVLSDVHWSQEAVRALIVHLLRELGRQKLLILLTSRQVIEGWQFTGRHGVAVLHLDPLPIEAARDFVAGVLPEVAGAPAMIDELVRRSGGNPFFLEELAGLVAADAGRPASDSLDDLPTTLRGLVSARLDALPAAQRTLLEEAAVLGRTGSIRALEAQAAATRQLVDIGPDLAALVDADLLERDGPRYQFRSDLIREVAYGTLTKSARARAHANFAQQILARSPRQIRNSAVAAVAEHFATASQILAEMPSVPGLDKTLIDQAARRWTGEAGERAIEAGVPRDALRWFSLGHSLAADRDDQARMLFGRARARCELHDLTRARGELDRLVELGVDDPALKAKVRLLIGDLDRKSGEIDRAVANLTDAAEQLEALDRPEDHALALRLLGMTEMHRSDARSRDAFGRSREVSARAGYRRGEAWALQSMAQAAFRSGRIGEARQLIAEAAEIFTEIDDAGGLSWTHGLEAWVLFHLGDWQQSRAVLEEVLPESRRRGDPWSLSIMLILETSLELWSGRTASAVEVARLALAEATRAQDPSHESQARSLLGRALVATGRAPEGLGELELAFTNAERSGDPEAIRVAAVANCAASARIGDPERALRWAARFAVTSEDGSRYGEVDLVAAVALALLQRGSLVEAASQLAWPTDSDSAGRFGVSAVVALTAAARGDHDQVAASLAEILDGNSTYLDRMLARLAAAGSALACQRPDDAVVNLTAAADEIRDTDDQIAQATVGLFEAEFSGAPDAVARMADRLLSLSIQPDPWHRVARLVAGRTTAAANG